MQVRADRSMSRFKRKSEKREAHENFVNFHHCWVMNILKNVQKKDLESLQLSASDREAL